MKSFAALTLALIVAATLLISIVVLLSETSPMTITELPAKLLPGHTLPTDVNCSWQFMQSSPPTSAVLCDYRGAPQLVYIIYDLHAHVIVITGVRTTGITIGDLIVAWGRPTGVSYNSYSTDVYWGKRSAWVYGPFFSPSSSLIIVHYHLEADRPTSPWRGFVN